MTTTNDTTGFDSRDAALQFLADDLGISPERDDAEDEFEALLVSWPWPGEELTKGQIRDIRRALANR